MLLVDRLNNSALQEFTLNNIDDGSIITCNLRYLSTQQGWVMDISNGDFTVNGLFLTVAPNILRQWSNVINFGIAVTTIDNYEPFYLDDFSSQRTSMFLLSSSEVQQIEDAINA